MHVSICSPQVFLELCCLAVIQFKIFSYICVRSSSHTSGPQQGKNITKQSTEPPPTMESLSSLSPPDTLKEVQTEDELAAFDAKISGFCYFLHFLLAQDYLPINYDFPTSNYFGKYNLKYRGWLDLNLRDDWRQVICLTRQKLPDEFYKDYRKVYDEYVASPAKTLGIDPDDLEARLKAIPLCERGEIFSLLGRYVEGASRKRRLDIDARWLTVSFRTEEQRKWPLYTQLLEAHAAQQARIHIASGLDSIPLTPSRESFTSAMTLAVGEFGERKGGEPGGGKEGHKVR